MNNFLYILALFWYIKVIYISKYSIYISCLCPSGNPALASDETSSIKSLGPFFLLSSGIPIASIKQLFESFVMFWTDKLALSTAQCGQYATQLEPTKKAINQSRKPKTFIPHIVPGVPA